MKQDQTKDMLSEKHLKQMLDVLEINGQFIKNILNQHGEKEVEEEEHTEYDLDMSEQKEKEDDMQLDSKLETEFTQIDSVTQKKMFSYNAVKNPKVEYFFDVVDNGLHSFYIRKAIEFYVDYSSRFKNI